MKLIYTTDNEQATADGSVDEWFSHIINDEAVYVATCVQMYKLRVEHKKGSIIVDSIDYNGELVFMDEDGNMDAPTDMFDESGFLMLELL